MNRIFTLKHYAFLCFVLLCNKATFSQTCTGAPINNICISPTNTFETPTFGNPSGDFIFNSSAANYQNPNSVNGSKVIISNFLTVQNNVFSVGAQIGNANKLASTATIQIVNPGNTNQVYCQAVVNISSSGCIAATFGGLAGVNIKIKFIFSRTGAGAVSFDNFGVDPAEAVLPVTFGSFNGKKTEVGTQLTWKVAGESNVKQYDVERSTTGTNGFVKIGSVPATGSNTYNFTDATVFNGTVIYRIKNIDNDGRFKYSTLLYFKNGVGTVPFRVVPTVVTSKTTVEHNAATGTAIITVSTMDGKILWNLRPATGATQTLVDMSNLPRGLYLLKWSDGDGNVEVAKVLKQ